MQLQKVDIMFAACDRALENNISFGSLLIVFIVVDFEAELCDGDFVVIDEELVVVTFGEALEILEVFVPPIPVVVVYLSLFCALAVTVTVRGNLDEQ